MNSSSFNSTALNASTLDVTVRVILQAYAYAMSAVKARVFRRNHVSSEQEANALVVSRKLAGGKVQQVVEANVESILRGFVRLAAGTSAFAEVVIVRPLVRTIVTAVAATSIGITGRKLARNELEVSTNSVFSGTGRIIFRHVVSSEASAQINAVAKALWKQQVLLVANAQVEVDTQIVKRVQFDEPAIDTQTFIVPFENNVFYVS